MYIPSPTMISSNLNTMSFFFHMNEIQKMVPHKDINTSAVKMPAPALSPVVIFMLALGSSTKIGLSPDEPADGFPLLVPPVLAVNGGGTLVIKLAWITLNADICSPTPCFPSQVDEYHVRPQVIPLEPPEHCAAAPLAQVCNLGTMKLDVKGAICVVAAIQRERYALKEG